MSGASHFLFDRDFRSPTSGDAKRLAALHEAEAEGYRRGLEDGRRDAEAQIAARLADALARLSAASGQLLAAADADRAAMQAEGLAFAMALGRKLAGEALARQPLAAIGEVAREAFQHLRGVPHLVVRVNEGLVDEVEGLMKGLARERGYEGRIVVMGEPDIPAGDARLEWADGGMARELSRLHAEAAKAAGTP
ncbi:flagellar assembly protein FliH [Salinarimonas soli]|uniref:Flagellar assembly protein FliH n=1 Tax=Salinarimonas soli TaxID=1638099 RepID=A0A5B2VCB9_9HYPH|nr:flagellar assembly protein FliH [Salinarimonas soli]KAA2236120.1 flagellar assembly protein FliH [Salinarimonas soli]